MNLKTITTMLEITYKLQILDRIFRIIGTFMEKIMILSKM
jgi:nucleoside permease NupC